jgi:hypothetical protein
MQREREMKKKCEGKSECEDRGFRNEIVMREKKIERKINFVREKKWSTWHF